MKSMAERLEHARQHRKEEQVIAAILHMSSPWGFLALISSGVIWAASKSRSRFLCLQALQAFSFQLISFVAFVLMFLIFMAGFYYAAFSGLIARTGATEPELTANLITAAIIGFAAIFFFQFIFPLWGIWAGIQILRGRSYLYPILGKLIVNWTSRQTFIVKPELRAQHDSAPDHGHVIAGLGHAAMLVGFSLFLCPILWATNRPRSRFLIHNLIQASLFQLIMTLLLAVLYFSVWGGGMLIGLLQMFGLASPEFMSTVTMLARVTYLPLSFVILFGILLLLSATYVIIATIQTFRGKEFHYPVIGRWLVRYINE